MVNAGDLLQLEYTPDLTEAGIAYARQRLTDIFSNDLPSMYIDMQQLVMDKAVELALRRYLTRRGIEHKTIAATSTGRVDPYHLLMGGWHCIIHASWIDAPKVVLQVRTQPECLLQAAAVLTAERIIAWIPGEKDAYIFGYIAGLPAEDQPGNHLGTAQRMLLLPAEWSRPKPWVLLGRLELFYRGREALQATLGGRGDSHAPVSEQVVLIPGGRVTSQHAYTALEYLHTAQLPTGPLDIYSTLLRRRHQVLPSAWQSLSYPAQTIYLAGFISHAEFARRSRRLDAGSQVFPGIFARDKARLLWVRELHPLCELFEPPTPGS